MLGQPLPHGSSAGDHVEDALRQSGLGAQLGEEQGGQPSDGGRLQHDRIARGQGRRYFPGEQHQGEVPRDDGTHHPDGAPLGQVLLHQLGPSGIMIQMANLKDSYICLFVQFWFDLPQRERPHPVSP